MGGGWREGQMGGVEPSKYEGRWLLNIWFMQRKMCIMDCITVD